MLKNLDHEPSLMTMTTSPYAVWRHAHFPMRTFEFQAIRTMQDAFDVILNMLGQSEIRTFLNRLDGGASGDRFDHLYAKLQQVDRTAPFTREVERQVDYTLRLLISSVIRNDTGKKGSLNIVSLDESVQLPEVKRHRVLVPEPTNENFSDALNLADRFNNTIDHDAREIYESALREVADSLHQFHVSTEARLLLDDRKMTTIQDSQRRVGEALADELEARYGIREGVFTYSVDYFLREDSATILEVHCPPRTIETSYMGLRAWSTDVIFPLDSAVRIACDTFAESQGRAALRVLVFNPEPHAGAMVTEALAFVKGFERAGCEQVHLVQSSAELRDCAPDYDIIYLCDELSDDSGQSATLTVRADQLLLPIPQMMELVKDRALMAQMCDSAGLAVGKNLTASQGDPLPVDALRRELGDWVLAKSRIHQPWWSQTKQRVEFLHLDLHRDKLQKLLDKEAIMFEEIITDSLDENGHFGELRVFSTMVL
ncbi:MAG: hypothetical protein RLP44_07955 [Aggregatilineales bacterium]